ncbi:MAG: hypothetical protein IPJ81_00375 [Chitinophagaceae bacterium]|nr:hypothetical protein [Chitinophagaceae bacterium]
MLDFHLINDTTSKSVIENGNLECAGSIDHYDFTYLKNIKIIEDWLDYYKDFRWTNEQVIQKIELLLSIYHSDNTSKSKVKTPEKTMLDILQKAKNTGNGLIAYGD